MVPYTLEFKTLKQTGNTRISEIGKLVGVGYQNAQGLGHYTPTPPLDASNGIQNTETNRKRIVKTPIIKTTIHY